MTTRAVHIELVSDFTTSAFLNALNGFSDRRGKSIVIYFDNETKYVSKNNRLKEVYQLFQSKEHQKTTRKHTSGHGCIVEFYTIPFLPSLWRIMKGCSEIHEGDI